jgi:hypothetical protein
MLVPARWIGLWLAATSCTSEQSARPELGGTNPQPSRPVILEPTQIPLPVAPKEPVRIDPEAESTLRKNAGESTVALDGAEPPKVTAMALENTARSDARGMMRESLRTATLVEGHRGVMPLALAPSDCVTVIAHGGIGVAEVDVFLVDPKGGDFRILAQDDRSGPLGIVGGQRGCFVVLGDPIPAAELWVQARQGSGSVVVGVYRAPRP